MRWLSKAMLVVSLMGVASTAQADQCELVSPEQATKALKELVIGKSIKNLCEPCGEKAPSAAEKIESVSARLVGGSVEVTVNGHKVDPYKSKEPMNGRLFRPRRHTLKALLQAQHLRLW
jgi:hypothetical protein